MGRSTIHTFYSHSKKSRQSCQSSQLPRLKPTDMLSKIFNRKVSKWIDLNYVDEKEMENVFSTYYGKCNDKMKATGAMDINFDTSNKNKDLIGLYNILQRVNFSYTASTESIVIMWKAKLNFMRLCQQNGQMVSEYYKRSLALKDMNKMQKSTSMMIWGLPK